MKKVLYFFPDNPTSKNSGNRTLALRLLEYFKNRGIAVHFVSTKDWSNDWNQPSINWLLENSLAEKVHILYRKPEKKNIIKYFFSYKLLYLLKNKKSVIPDLASQPLKQQFNNVLKQYSFDFVIISYAQWANLIKDNAFLGNATTIIDTHDFLTSQYQHNKYFKLGACFLEEIKRLRLFDVIWVTSFDEQYLFKQFCKQNDVRVITINMDRNFEDEKTDLLYEYDLIYVASDNLHNQLAAKWFFESVYPTLPASIKICVVGKISGCIKDYSNVIKIPFAEDIGVYYKVARVAICPMLTGTGIKIKVVEAFSYGLPVVGTSGALDGLPNKVNNGCLVSDEPDVFAAHIITLLTNRQVYYEQQQQAKMLFEKCFSAEIGFNALDKVIFKQKNKS